MRCKLVVALAPNYCMTGNAATIVIRIPIVACIPITDDVLRVRPDATSNIISDTVAIIGLRQSPA